MDNDRIFASTLIVLAACSASTALGQATARYEIHSLGEFGGGLNSAPSAINNSSTIAGTALRFWEPTNPTAFTWSDGTYTDVSALFGKRGYCSAINDNGDLALATNPGFLLNKRGDAIITRNGTPVILSRNFFSPSAANDLDESATLVAGTVCTRRDDLSSRQAAFWRNDVPTLLGTLGGPISWGMALNDAGVVVGAAETPQTDPDGFFYRHAYRWTETGGMQDLGSLAADDLHANSFASDVSDLGWIVGSSDSDVQYVTRAFLYRDGGMTDLGALGDENFTAFAEAINDNGLVVGMAFDEFGFSRAVRWGPRGIETLDSLLPDASGWELGSALAVNDHGVITGTGLINGESRAYILTPTKLELTVSAVRPGFDTTLTADNASPGEEVSFFFGRSQGTADVLALAVRLDLASPTLIGTQTANDAGSARIAAPVPPNARRGLTIHFQAAEYTRVSQVVTSVVQ